MPSDGCASLPADNGPEVNTPGHTYGLVGRKRSLTEGGIRMPTLLEWPAMIKANHNSTYPGVSNDLFPTVLCARSSVLVSVSCCLLLCCWRCSCLGREEDCLDSRAR